MALYNFKNLKIVKTSPQTYFQENFIAAVYGQHVPEYIF